MKSAPVAAPASSYRFVKFDQAFAHEINAVLSVGAPLPAEKVLDIGFRILKRLNAASKDESFGGACAVVHALVQNFAGFCSREDAPKNPYALNLRTVLSFISALSLDQSYAASVPRDPEVDQGLVHLRALQSATRAYFAQTPTACRDRQNEYPRQAPYVMKAWIDPTYNPNFTVTTRGPSVDQAHNAAPTTARSPFSRKPPLQASHSVWLGALGVPTSRSAS